MYTIVTGLKSDWLQYANHNTIHQELTLAPDKTRAHRQRRTHGLQYSLTPLYFGFFLGGG